MEVVPEGIFLSQLPRGFISLPFLSRVIIEFEKKKTGQKIPMPMVVTFHEAEAKVLYETRGLKAFNFDQLNKALNPCSSTKQTK